MRKRIISLLLTFLMIIFIIPFTASAYEYNKSQSEAVEWIKARANEGWWEDIDGWYGCQCVDLVMKYYQWFGYNRKSGHAYEYASGRAPAGSTWYYSSTPIPGAVFVKSQDSDYEFGHVGLVYAVDENYIYTVETNIVYPYDGGQYYASAKYKTRSKSFAATYICPDFPKEFKKPTFEQWFYDGYTYVGDTSASLGMHVNVPSGNISQVGMTLWDPNMNVIGTVWFDASVSPVNRNYYFETDVDYNYTLQPRKTYYYQPVAFVDGAPYYGPQWSFTTTGCSVHNWGGWLITAAPTCTSDGVSIRSCSRCGEKQTKAVSALGHDYAAVVTAPTCTDSGYTTYTCSRCSDKYIADEVPANGHEYECVRVVEPTCTEEGYSVHQCKHCGDTFEAGGVEPLGHDFGEWFQHPANAAKEIRFCTRCDAFETRNKENIIEDEIKIEKLGGYEVKLTGLDSSLVYTIRFATGEYSNASAVKKGLNAGFLQVSGVSEATITLPTDGLHTIAATVGSEQKFIGTVTIDETDMMKEVDLYIDDLNIKVNNLYGATRVNLMQNGNVVMKINPASFTTDGLKTWAEFAAPSSGQYTIRVLFEDDHIEAPFTVTVPAANVSANGRIFTLSNYGVNNVSYIRFAKGVITTAAEMKSASDLRTFGRKYFTTDTAAFAALDAQNGETTAYTVQIVYKSGYTEFVTFDITPAVPVVTTGNGTITLTNVQTGDYYLDWVRCAPGELDSMYAIRHAEGSQVRKTGHIINGTITFTGLSAGKYTLYYLYDGNNLSEGMVTVTVQ